MKRDNGLLLKRDRERCKAAAYAKTETEARIYSTIRNGGGI